MERGRRPTGEGIGGSGDERAWTERLYAELRSAAARRLRRESPGHTLQPTALAHEVYLRMADQRSVPPGGEDHLMALASEMIRRVLVDHARRRGRLRRGGDRRRVTLGGLEPAGAGAEVDVLELDEALTRLGQLHPRQARVVELRFFGGLGVEQAAAHLGVSPRTVESDWRVARAWLRRELEDGA